MNNLTSRTSIVSSIRRVLRPHPREPARHRRLRRNVRRPIDGDLGERASGGNRSPPELRLNVPGVDLLLLLRPGDRGRTSVGDAERRANVVTRIGDEDVVTRRDGDICGVDKKRVVGHL